MEKKIELETYWRLIGDLWRLIGDLLETYGDSILDLWKKLEKVLG